MSDLRSRSFPAQDTQTTGLLTPQNSSPPRLTRPFDQDDTMVNPQAAARRSFPDSYGTPALDLMHSTNAIRFRESDLREVQMQTYFDNSGTLESTRPTPSLSQFSQSTHSTPITARHRGSRRGRGGKTPGHRAYQPRQQAATNPGAAFDDVSISGAFSHYRQTRLTFAPSAAESAVNTNVAVGTRLRATGRPRPNIDSFSHPGSESTHATPTPTERPTQAGRVLLGPPPVSTMHLTSDHDPFTTPCTAPVTTAVPQAMPRVSPASSSPNDITGDPRVHPRRTTGRIPRTKMADLTLESMSPNWMVCQLVLRLNLASLSMFHVAGRIFDGQATLVRLGWSSDEQDPGALECTTATRNEIQRVVESVAADHSAGQPASIIKGIQQVLQAQ
jgi:hypothetical protein